MSVSARFFVFWVMRVSLVGVWCWGSSAGSKKGAGCDPVRLKCSDGMGVLGGIVGLSLCWVVCWHVGGMACVWVSGWVMLPVGGARFHPRVWML